MVQELDSYIKLLHQLHLLCGLEPSCSCGMKSRVKSAMAMGISLPALPVIKAVVRCKAGRFIKMPREDQITSSMSPPQDRAGIVTPWRQQGLLSLMLHGYKSTNMNSYGTAWSIAIYFSVSFAWTSWSCLQATMLFCNDAPTQHDWGVRRPWARQSRWHTAMWMSFSPDQPYNLI